jgi:predicted ATPase
MDAQIRRRRTYDILKRILLRESVNQPLMVIVEDLHWIDEQTQGFLDFLVDSLSTAQLLLLVSYRPEYSHRWNSKAYHRDLRLEPLNHESAEEMLTEMVGDGQDLVPVKRFIIDRAEGNPLFMEEIYLALIEDGALVRDGIRIRLARSMNTVRVPATVQAVLAVGAGGRGMRLQACAHAGSRLQRATGRAAQAPP